MNVVVGVDPGGRYTGLVIRHGDLLIAARVLTRPAEHDIADHHLLGEWAGVVRLEVGAFLDDAAGHIGVDPDGIGDGQLPDGVDLAVEGVRRPNPHVTRADGNSKTNPDGIMATAGLYAVLTDRWPTALTVPPGGNGSHVADAYPGRIRKHARLGGPSEHARSAWDVAGAAPWHRRINQHRTPTGRTR